MLQRLARMLKDQVTGVVRRREARRETLKRLAQQPWFDDLTVPTQPSASVREMQIRAEGVAHAVGHIPSD